MEIALEDGFSKPAFLDETRFNPCSIGNCSGRKQTPILRPSINGVSILVLLEIALEAYFPVIKWSPRSGFNPCSIGNCSGSIFRIEKTPVHSCFNPCSIGNCSGSMDASLIQMMVDMFQSLFYWKLLWKRNYGQDTILHHAGFNPCSIGNCSGSRVKKPCFSRLFCFNPCSIGNCSGSYLANFFYARRVSVSILVLLEIALEESAPNRKVGPVTFVSILVLLEIALEAIPDKDAFFPLQPVSILVLLEIALEDIRSVPSRCVTVEFQSLFYWKLLWKSLPKR